MDQGLIPRRYAKALYEVAVDRKADTALYNLALTLNEAFVSNQQLQGAMANPFVESADKKGLLTTAAGIDAGAQGADTFVDFIDLLEQNGRLSLAWDISRAYVDLYRQKNHIFEVTVTSAVPLNSQAMARLEKIVKEHLKGGSPEFSIKIDPEIVGGFIITIGSERLDASVAGELKALRQSLIH